MALPLSRDHSRCRPIVRFKFVAIIDRPLFRRIDQQNVIRKIQNEVALVVVAIEPLSNRLELEYEIVAEPHRSRDGGLRRRMSCRACEAPRTPMAVGCGVLPGTYEGMRGRNRLFALNRHSGL